MGPEFVISSTQSCLDVLNALYNATRGAERQDWVDIQTKELNLWANTLGVFADGRYSIRYRLADSPQQTAIICQLLEALHGHLAIFFTLLTGDKKYEPTDEEQDSSSDDSASEQSTHTSVNIRAAKVETTLERLGRLAIRLRQDGATRAAQAALHFTPMEDDQATSLVPEFESLTQITVDRALKTKRADVMASLQPTGTETSVFSGIAENKPPKLAVPDFLVDQFLVDRLKSTMLLRWKRICYNRHHADGLAGNAPKRPARNDPREVGPGKRGPTSAAALPMSGAMPTQRQTEPRKDRNLTAGPKSAATKRAADDVVVAGSDTDRAPAKTITTKVRAGDLAFPMAPEVDKGAKLFNCPLCGRPQPTHLLRDAQWKVHVMRDLSPYICLIESCQHGQKTYPSHDEWLSHTRTEHSRTHWICEQCSPVSNFKDAESYKQHLLSVHADQDVASTASFMVDFGAKRQSPIVFEHCVFCGFVPEAHLSNSQCEEAQKLIIEHMSKTHMQFFALSCLPWDYAGAEIRSSQKDGEKPDSISENARIEILDDEQLAIGDDGDAAAPDTGTSLINTSLAEIKKRWDSTMGDSNDRVDEWRSRVDGTEDNDNLELEVAEVEYIRRGAQQLDQVYDGKNLFDVIRTANEDRLRHYLASEPQLPTFSSDPNLPWSGSVLHAAIKAGSATCVQLLCRAGAEMEHDVARLGTPLAFAVLLQQEQIVRVLIAEGARVNLPALTHGAPLAYASALGSVELFGLLLDHGADIGREVFLDCHIFTETTNSQLNNGILPGGTRYCSANQFLCVEAPPVFVAAMYGHDHLVSLALQKGASVDTRATVTAERIRKSDDPNWSLSLLIWLATVNRAGLTQELLDAGADVEGVDQEGDDALACAAASSAFEAMTVLLDHLRGHTSEQVILDKALVIGCRVADLKCLELLIDRGANVDTIQERGTPLTAAANKGDLQFVRFLIDRKADVNLFTKDGLSPLIAACVKPAQDVVELLVQNGADVNLGSGSDTYPSPPLFNACQVDDLRPAAYLIEHGAKVRTRNALGFAALHDACWNELPEHVDLLMQNGAELNVKSHYGETPLAIAARRGSAKAVIALLRHGADVGIKDSTEQNALMSAARYGFETILQRLLNAGAEVNARDSDGQTALALACANGHVKAVEVLLRYGADVNLGNDNWRTPAFDVCAHGHAAILKLLIEHGALLDLQDQDGKFLIEHAVLSGSVECLQLVVDNLGATSPSGLENMWTPALFSGAAASVLTCLPMLIKRAGPDPLNESGETPLVIAVRNQEPEVVKFFLQHEASANARDLEGRPVLHMAVNLLNKHVVSLLLEAGADVTEVDQQHKTALLSMGACISTTDHDAHQAIKGILLDHGADPDVVDADGMSPFTLSLRHSHCLEDVRLLLRSGANVLSVDSRLDENNSALRYAVLCSSPEKLALILQDRSDGLSKLVIRNLLRYALGLHKVEHALILYQEYHGQLTLDTFSAGEMRAVRMMLSRLLQRRDPSEDRKRATLDFCEVTFWFLLQQVRGFRAGAKALGEPQRLSDETLGDLREGRIETGDYDAYEPHRRRRPQTSREKGKAPVIVHRPEGKVSSTEAMDGERLEGASLQPKKRVQIDESRSALP